MQVLLSEEMLKQGEAFIEQKGHGSETPCGHVGLGYNLAKK